MGRIKEHVEPEGYRVGDLAIDTTHRQIRRQGKVLPCGKLTFELLVVLAQQAPRVVDYATMAERIWGGRYVSPATVKRRVSLLRETLGENADSPSYIRVVRGHGYGLIPEVRSLDMRRRRLPHEMLSAVVAAALLLVFFIGAEIGYQDGLSPAIPGLQGSASIFVTSWPRELPQDEYSFVIDMAQSFLSAIDRTDFLGRLGHARRNADITDRDSLAVMANVVDNDFDSIYVTLALLRDDRPDYRETRAAELSSFARVLQDIPAEESGSEESAPRLGRDAGPARSEKYQLHVFVPAQIRGENFVLVASLRFDRAAVRSEERSIQSEAATSVTSAIDEQLAKLETGEWENGP